MRSSDTLKIIGFTLFIGLVTSGCSSDIEQHPTGDQGPEYEDITQQFLSDYRGAYGEEIYFDGKDSLTRLNIRYVPVEENSANHIKCFYQDTFRIKKVERRKDLVKKLEDAEAGYPNILIGIEYQNSQLDSSPNDSYIYTRKEEKKESVTTVSYELVDPSNKVKRNTAVGICTKAMSDHATSMSTTYSNSSRTAFGFHDINQDYLVQYRSVTGREAQNFKTMLMKALLVHSKVDQLDVTNLFFEFYSQEDIRQFEENFYQADTKEDSPLESHTNRVILDTDPFNSIFSLNYLSELKFKDSSKNRYCDFSISGEARVFYSESAVDRLKLIFQDESPLLIWRAREINSRGNKFVDRPEDLKELLEKEKRSLSGCDFAVAFETMINSADSNELPFLILEDTKKDHLSFKLPKGWEAEKYEPTHIKLDLQK